MSSIVGHEVAQTAAIAQRLVLRTRGVDDDHAAPGSVVCAVNGPP